MKSKKLASFTLVEITIALLISGIIVTILFRFFSFTNNYQRDRILLSNEIREVFITRKLLLESFSDSTAKQIVIENLAINILEEELDSDEFTTKRFFIYSEKGIDTLVIQKRKSELERLEDL